MSAEGANIYWNNGDVTARSGSGNGSNTEHAEVNVNQPARETESDLTKELIDIAAATGQGTEARRLHGDEGAVDWGKIASKTHEGLKKAGRGVEKAGRFAAFQGNRAFDWVTQRDIEFFSNPSLSDLEKARNALSAVRARQKSVWSRVPGPWKLSDADVMLAEHEYEMMFQQQVIDAMTEAVNRHGVEYFESPEAQLQMLQMYANEKALRAAADTAAQGARKGGKLGAYLARHPGLRVGLGIGMMVGGSAATLLGIGPAAGMIGAGMYTASRANIERIQGGVRSKREDNRLQKELNAIMSRNNAAGQMVLDDFVQNVNERDRKGRSKLKPEARAFINDAASGQALPDDLKLVLLQMRDAENQLNARGDISDTKGIESWISENEPDVVANIMSQALLSSLQWEREEANRQGRGNRYKIATSIGMGAIGVAALGGFSATAKMPETIRASLGMGGFGLAEYLIYKRRKKKSGN